MSARKTILQGTLILTAVGFLCRFMGFFYRIFLSHTFGEENVGLYQLTFPVFALCISFTSAGLETAISRTVARKQSLHQPREASETLCLGLFISCLLSVITMIILQKNAADLSTALLGDPRCEEILILLSYALPLSSIHGCIMGYCYGLKQTQIPAVSQLIEQTARILSVFCLYRFAIRNGLHADISIAAAGIAFGELFSTFYSVRGLQKSRSDIFRPGFSFSSIRLRFRELIPLSLPLTANRVLLGLLQGIEAVSIPGCLKLYNHSTSEALSTYGVLTGMALPCILFPSAITNSVSIMLMPTVAELQVKDQASGIRKLLQKVLGSCFLMGLFCCLFFLFFGQLIGQFLFASDLAGNFIITLAWICPFLYVNGSLLSVLNGFGKTTTSFTINMVGLAIRIGSVFFAIPVFGIQGYLWGLLISQLAVSICCSVVLKHLISA